MRLSRRLKKVEVGITARHKAKMHELWLVLADFQARRKSGVEISPEETQRFARVYELLDIARARRDKALGIRRRP
jgi:uncharacterized protein (DUF2384 family)